MTAPNAPTAPNNTVATVRTAIQTTALTAVTLVLFNIFGWEIEADDLIPFLPAFGVAAAIFYRFSLVVSEKVPAVGYVLFGFPRKAPEYPVVPSEDLEP